MHHQKQPMRALCASICVGLVITITLFVFKGFLGVSLVPEIVTLQLSDFIQKVSREFPTEAEKKPVKIRLINLPTLESPDSNFVSRERLARLITSLDEAKVSVIFVDVNLSRPAKGDKDIARALANLKYAKAVISLALETRPGMDCRGRTDFVDGRFASNDQVIFPSSMKLSNGWTNVWFGSHELENDSDSIVRALCPYTTAWLSPENGIPQKVAIPSSALLAAKLSTLPEPNKDNLDRLIKEGETIPRAGKSPPEWIFYRKPADFEPRRIRFSILEPQHGSESRRAPVLAEGITMYPLALAEMADADKSDLAQSIAIVGSSDPAPGDHINTPVGSVSGLIVQATAVAAVARQDYLIEHHDFKAELLSELVLVVLGCAAFTLLNEGGVAFLNLIAKSILRGEARTRAVSALKPMRVAATTIVYVASAIIVGAGLIIISVVMAVRDNLEGVQIDLAITLLGIFAEQIIRMGSRVEEKVKDWVDFVFDKFSADRNQTEGTQNGTD